MSTMMRRLEEAGFVERGPDPRDARVRRIEATPRGRAALAALLDRAVQLTRAERLEEEASWSPWREAIPMMRPPSMWRTASRTQRKALVRFRSINSWNSSGAVSKTSRRIDRPASGRRCRPRTDQVFAASLKFIKHGIGRNILQAQEQTVGRGNPDCRCTTHRQGFYGLKDVINIPALEDLFSKRQFALIEQQQPAVIKRYCPWQIFKWHMNFN